VTKNIRIRSDRYAYVCVSFHFVFKVRISVKIKGKGFRVGGCIPRSNTKVLPNNNKVFNATIKDDLGNGRS